MTSDALREQMVRQLESEYEDRGWTLRPDIKSAMLDVPRHLFCPGFSREDAYSAGKALVTKRDGQQAVSSVSAPSVVATMLSQAADAAGSLQGLDFLEIGSGGYNASLARRLTGAGGSVTTVDLDPEVTDRAADCLGKAGFNDVTVICADAGKPIEPGRRWDVIMATVGVWDIAPSWRDQLVDGGVLVVPLRTWGTTRSWALRRQGDRLESISQRLCGFVPVRGEGAHEIRYPDLGGGVSVRLDEGQTANWAAAGPLLSQPREEAWAGARLAPRTTLADLDLWLACHQDGEPGEFAMLTAGDEALDSGIVAPSWRHGTPVVYDGSTLVYRAANRWDDRMFDVGAYAHGSGAAEAAGRMTGVMRAWVDAGTPAPVMHVFPGDTPDSDLPPGTILHKRHNHIVVTW